MEADFQREYAINLTSELGRLSWRRFIVLVRGLGPHSATAAKLQARIYGRPGPRGKNDTTGVPIIRGKDAVASELGRLFGTAPGSPVEPS